MEAAVSEHSRDVSNGTTTAKIYSPVISLEEGAKPNNEEETYEGQSDSPTSNHLIVIPLLPVGNDINCLNFPSDLSRLGSKCWHCSLPSRWSPLTLVSNCTIY